MKNLQLDYSNQFEVRKYINETVVPSIYEVLVDDYYNGEIDDIQSDLNDNVWEIINNLGDVIYNFQARKVAEAFDYCPFNSVSDMTGEKYNSWNEMAFDIIYQEFYNKYSDLLG